ncbi:hypothetical protein ADE_03330 [Achromobacter denitrificans]|nr:hypothetical protein ADE_03330 [Achromobacter denitrificans]
MVQMREALRRHSSPMRSVQTGTNTPASASRNSRRRRMPDMRTQASRTMKGAVAGAAVKMRFGGGPERGRGAGPGGMAGKEKRRGARIMVFRLVWERRGRPA